MRALAKSLALLAILAGAARADLPNGGFEKGQGRPQGWRLVGSGQWSGAARSGDRAIAVVGKPQTSDYWRTEPLGLRPKTLYRFSFWARADKTSGGCIISGPNFCNRDFRLHTRWQRHSFVFATPTDPAGAFIRLGHWHASATIWFDDSALRPVIPLHVQRDRLALGAGEEIDGTTYTFTTTLNGEGSNFARTLVDFNCGFNSDRWCLGGGQWVVYRFALPERQLSATVEINCNYRVGGTGVLEASRDGKEWSRLGTFEKVGRLRLEVPASLFPAEAVFLRLRALADASFQLNDIRYEARLERPLGFVVGATTFLEVTREDPRFPVRILSLPVGGSAQTVSLKVSNQTANPHRLTLTATIASEGRPPLSKRLEATLEGGQAKDLALRAPPAACGRNGLEIALAAGALEVFRAVAAFRLSALDDASYGFALPSPPGCRLWWCESARKVSRTRPAPQAHGTPIELSAARGESEAVQLVLRPDQATRLRGVRLDSLKCGRSELPPSALTTRVVQYVRITHPTDAEGRRGWWPDPLPPLEENHPLSQKVNNPIWLNFHVPVDQPAGPYEGLLVVATDKWTVAVPVRLRVWDFALPRTPHLQTAFGLSVGNIRRYHNLTTDAELRKVFDLYMQDFAHHRIAPYDPAALDPIRVTFNTGPWEGGAIVAEDPRAGALCMRIDDQNPHASITAHNKRLIPIQTGRRYTLSWSARTAKAKQPYLVSLEQYDTQRRWLSGNNMDFLRTGQTTWARQEARVPGPGQREFDPRCRFLRLVLRPVPYSDAGEATGTAWFDDVRLVAEGEARNLVSDGSFEGVPSRLEATMDFAAFDRACQRYLDGLGFNSIMVRLRGLGGGTFHARHEGRIGPFPQGTPQYEKLMASQGHQLVAHLREKGWLDKAYLYWFDEPAPRDYPFVVEGMRLIERTAPGLTRMLTEQPEPPLFGHVDLWCPVLSNYDHKVGLERQRLGERFWWYLCCGPKAPYIGLFIDHPPTDLRAWAWLSRKWGIRGHLVWSTNYWTSSCAYPPPALQNPWEDPMSYVSGYGRKPGQIGYWGNGDGRFLYPPNRNPAEDKRKFVCGPIPSIRWEMLRDGIEDYDYFAILDRLIAQAERTGKVPANLVAEARRLGVVPDAVVADGRTYSKDPGPLLAHRRKLGQRIERLAHALEER